MERRLRTLALLAAAVLLASVSLAGCGGEDAPSTPAVCSSVDDLHSSVEDLKNVDLTKGALATLQDKLATVASDLKTVQTDAKSEYATEVDAVDQATASVGSSLKAAAASPSATTVAAVGAAVQALWTSLTTLHEAIKSTC